MQYFALIQSRMNLPKARIVHDTLHSLTSLKQLNISVDFARHLPLRSVAEDLLVHDVKSLLFLNYNSLTSVTWTVPSSAILHELRDLPNLAFLSYEFHAGLDVAEYTFSNVIGTWPSLASFTMIINVLSRYKSALLHALNRDQYPRLLEVAFRGQLPFQSVTEFLARNTTLQSVDIDGFLLPNPNDVADSDFILPTLPALEQFTAPPLGVRSVLNSTQPRLTKCVLYGIGRGYLPRRGDRSVNMFLNELELVSGHVIASKTTTCSELSNLVLDNLTVHHFQPDTALQKSSHRLSNVAKDLAVHNIQLRTKDDKLVSKMFQ